MVAETKTVIMGRVIFIICFFNVVNMNELMKSLLTTRQVLDGVRKVQPNNRPPGGGLVTSQL